MEIKSIKKLKLYGFNNLTKTLSFNMYDICYATSPEHRQDYIKYIDEEDSRFASGIYYRDIHFQEYFEKLKE